MSQRQTNARHVTGPVTWREKEINAAGLRGVGRSCDGGTMEGC